jgi:GPH family glycoside/pentoside/hexuronide:cation symporter
MSHDQGKPLPAGRIVGYAAGDFALNLMFSFCTLFLLYYYTDVLGLTATTGGLIIMAALVWEGLFDPLMGVLANRTRTLGGRYRPYILYGAPILSLSFVAMFVPTGLAGTSLALYAFATHMVFRTAYTVVGIPYISLSADMTRSSTERSKIAGARMLFALASGLTLAAGTLPLSKALGGGVLGFFRLSLIYAGVAVAIFFLCYRSTREGSGDDTRAPAFGAMIRMIRDNTPLLLLLGGTVIASVAGTLSGKTLIYYVKYNLAAPDAVTPSLTLLTAAAGLSIPVWVALGSRLSKRATWLCGSVISVVTLLLMFALAPPVGPVFWGFLVALGVGNGAFYLTFWSMVPDTVEYGEFRSRVRAEGAIYGLVSLTQKIALGIGVGLLGVLLDAIGYKPNVAQTPATLMGIKVLLTIAPAALGMVVGGIIYFYPLDRPLHGRLASAVAWRSRELLLKKG